jgi:hypothetical protein
MRVMNRLVAVLTALLFVLSACGGTSPSSPSSPATSPTPTAAATPGGPGSPTAAPTPAPTRSPGASPTSDAAAVYREIEDQVAAERGLPAKERIEPAVLSQAEAKARLKAQFEKDNPPDKIAVTEETLKALGLLPADASLSDLSVDMLGSQVAGFYDPASREMVVVSKSGSIGAAEKVTFAHEFTHALQDQSFGLEGIDVDAVGQGDRSLARLALVEGDATLVMTRWLADHLTPAELGDLLNVDPGAQAQLERLPAILRETLLFPYQQGLIFVNDIWARGGWAAVDAAFGRLPDSTEQILHPEKYQAREMPAEVVLDAGALAKAMGPGWSATPEDTLGEFQLSIWLRENGVKALDAQAAAAGWGGDRLEYIRGPNGAYALVLSTTWDTVADAGQFHEAAVQAAMRLPGSAGQMPGVADVESPGHAGRDARTVRVLAASDAATLKTLQWALARS